MKIKNDRFIEGETGCRNRDLKGHAMLTARQLICKDPLPLIKRILMVGKFSRSNTVAARASLVGISPALAITKIRLTAVVVTRPFPNANALVQCLIAASISSIADASACRRQ